MKKQLLRLLLCAGLLAGLLTVTALAADWTYDPNDETLTNSGGTVTLKNVTDNGANGLVIGNNQDFTGVTLDLTGQITDGSGATYTLISIGDQAFSQCEKLTTVDLSGCTSLGTIGVRAFYNCGELTAADLSGCTSLRTIDYQAFRGCLGLEEVTLPESLTAIWEYAFDGCSSLTQLVLLSQNPPYPASGALPTDNPNFRIVVPGGSVEAYKQAPDWVGYAASIEALTYGLTVATDSPSLELPQGATPAGAAFTITNNSNVTVSGLKISLTDSGNFEVDTSEMAASLAPNGTTTFTVTPNHDLAVGNYETTITVTGDQSVTETASLTCTVKKVEIAADPASLDFGSAYTGYTQPGSQTVTVTNTGEQAVTLTQPLDTAYFTVGPLSDAALAPNEQAAFTVQPKTGLAPGEYSETLAISGQSGGRPVKLQVLLSFKVAEPVYGISSDTTVWNFGTVTEGYSEAPAGKEVTVTNTGNQTVTVTLPAGTNYAITAGAGFTNDAATIAPNGTAAFTIRPKTGLAPGTYSETLTVSGTYSVSADVALRFVVERQSGGGSSGGGGGGSGSAMYAVSLAAPEHGTVTVSPKSAVKGSTVTVTATPDEGYRLDTLTVTDSQGNRLKLTDQGGGKFTFIMPGSQVKVEASFVLIPQEPEPLPFADVAETAWYYDGVRYAYEHGLMTGTSETTFNPDGATSRAMLAAILWRLEGSPVVNYAMDFADVEEGQWYTEAIRWAASEGIVTGYGDGAFGTNDSITREQFAVMLYRYAGTQPASGTLSAFRDGPAVSDWAAEAVGWAVEAGLITGTGDGSALTPQGQATRAQAAVLLMRFCQEYMA